MPRPTPLSAILSASFLLMGCSSFQPRAPELNLPPLPPEVTAPCPEPEPVQADRADGGLSLSATFLLILRDAAAAAECRRRQAVLAQMVKYQQQVREEYQRTLSNPKPWYQFW